ncbi:MAG TPA: heparan-alpha-glucosaminide N-acetyltransferase domain-containing protein [Longilinea sp.]|nr:heparan-alpha-glucosaminide N-acetyltransferase domain-containing protein [Longilinea sp.]
MTQTASEPHKPRFSSIDAFRGFAIMTMVLANYLAGVEWIPAWLKHAPDVGLTVIDLVAPFFIFAIGLTYGISTRRRQQRDGSKAMTGHFVRRWLALIGIGAILSAAEMAVLYNNGDADWGVLQSIGVAGLLTLPMLFTPTWVRFLTAGGLLVVYQILLNNGWLYPVLSSSHGGIMGCLGWAGMLILTTALADIFHSTKVSRWWFALAALVVLLAGWGAAETPWALISKNRVSSSYVLVSTGISGLVFFVFYLLTDKAGWGARLLSWWGQNPLLLYIAHYFVLSIVVLPSAAGWYGQAPLWLVITQAVGLLVILSVFAWWLQKKHWIISI